MKEMKQMSESFMVAVVLAIVGGFLDAYTYVCRDQVFANAQTGNIVGIGITFANGEYLKILRYFIPVVAFSIGIMMTIFIRNNCFKKYDLHWRQVVLIIEMIVMFIIGFIPIGKMNVVANVMVSFICSMQAECFRKVLGKPFSSTMCTGNLRSGVEYLYQGFYYQDKNAIANSIHYLFIILFFILGAVLGVWITKQIYEKAIFICIIFVSIALCGMFKK